jgi:RNA-directed DNA polymerase
VLANLFMHYAFDSWLGREFPSVEFERYADDAVVPVSASVKPSRCGWRWRPGWIGRAAAASRQNPDRVYCGTDKRLRRTRGTSFTFLGYAFRPRKAKGKDGKGFTSFLPAVSPQALKAMGQQVRLWRIHRRIGLDLDQLAAQINPSWQAG